jgi:hypothetical protein
MESSVLNRKDEKNPAEAGRPRWGSGQDGFLCLVIGLVGFGAAASMAACKHMRTCSSWRRASHAWQMLVSLRSLVWSVTSFKVFCFAFMLGWPPMGRKMDRGRIGRTIKPSEPTVSENGGLSVQHLFHLFLSVASGHGLENVAYPGNRHLPHNPAFPVSLHQLVN